MVTVAAAAAVGIQTAVLLFAVVCVVPSSVESAYSVELDAPPVAVAINRVGTLNEFMTIV